jgi:hypothetical protein
MLLLIAIVGGPKLMMGRHDRSESLFYYFRLEDQVPESHLLRLIDRHVDFGFVRERLKDSYSDTGCPTERRVASRGGDDLSLRSMARQEAAVHRCRC